MAKGYIYTVATVESDYFQANPHNIPVWNAALNRLILGPCKVPIRRKLGVGDYIFGVSPAKTKPRRILFAARIDEKTSYREAYARWTELRGPEGPIHVSPVDRPGLPYPACSYDFISGSIHENRWEKDLADRELDAFFLCAPAQNVVGRWLGPDGPVVTGDILEFLRDCSVHGQVGLLNANNDAASESIPIRHGRLFTGLHLETDQPEALVGLCEAQTSTAPCVPYLKAHQDRSTSARRFGRGRRNARPSRKSAGCER